MDIDRCLTRGALEVERFDVFTVSDFSSYVLCLQQLAVKRESLSHIRQFLLKLTLRTAQVNLLTIFGRLRLPYVVRILVVVEVEEWLSNHVS